MLEMDPLVQSILVGCVSSAATIAAIKVEMRWLRRDVNALYKWAEQHAKEHNVPHPLPFSSTEH